TQTGDFPSAEYALAYLSALRPSDETAAAFAAASPDAQAPADDEGDILVVAAQGRAPDYVEQRVPVGHALVLAGAYMSDDNRRVANELVVEGLFKWVNYPQLVAVSGQQYVDASVRIDGSPADVSLALDVERESYDYYLGIEGRLAFGALTRLITRAVAAQATEAAVGQGRDGGQALAGFILGKAVEGAMIVADVPDTRSWNSLPSYYWVSRQRVKAGKHEVRVSAGGQTVEQTVDVWPGGFATVVVHTLN